LAIDCVIVDLDGTLADATHRTKHFPDGKLNWALFKAPHRIADDQLHHIVADVVRLLRSKWPIIYVSGRNDDCYDVTMQWLKKHDLWQAPELLIMRKTGDSRHDYEVKKEILDQLIADGYNPVLSLDDRNNVVKMWRDNGIPCFQVAEGDF
jgi:hypothetical protein